MLLHTEYYSFPGAVDELRVWHVATGPSLGCEMDYSTCFNQLIGFAGSHSR